MSKICGNVAFWIFRLGDIQLVHSGNDSGDRLVRLRQRRQVLGEDEEISTQHERSGISSRQIPLPKKRQPKSKLEATVRSMVIREMDFAILMVICYLLKCWFMSFRKVIRAYQDSWDNRCRILFCCMGNSDRSRVRISIFSSAEWTFRFIPLRQMEHWLRNGPISIQSLGTSEIDWRSFLANNCQ